MRPRKHARCGCGWPGTLYLIECQGIEPHVRYVCEFHAMNLGKEARMTEMTDEEAVIWKVMTS